MKKVFFAVAAVAFAIGSTACGGGPRMENQKDSISYCIGANVGLSVKFSVEELQLDQADVLASVKEFIANGDINSDEFMNNMQQLQMFQYNKFMPYMYAAEAHKNSERPDTLPALPQLYDETYTRENVSRWIGQTMAGNVVALKEELNLDQVEHGMQDGLKVEDIEKMDEVLKITQEQMNPLFEAMDKKMREKAEAELKSIAETNAKASAEWLAEVEKQEGVQKTESGLLYRIDREGKGKRATKDEDIVKVDYEGRTREGRIFDSSYERGQAIEFPLNGVIKGWTEGMKLVKAGGQITLWIPAELAYGERGAGQDIGPNEALEFTVELHEVNPKAKKK
ncbi:MAG: FKBP-type peptidyl-prolyl cis-trans isomerase [Alistipes sp.]|nr:FKBP-type peptidyl-prolyl cis-trans isomerase [Alistipes sp.]